MSEENIPYRIRGMVTIIETEEVIAFDYPDVGTFLENVLYNIALASKVLGKTLAPNKPVEDGDNMRITVLYKDTTTPYMIVDAERYLT